MELLAAIALVLTVLGSHIAFRSFTSPSEELFMALRFNIMSSAVLALQYFWSGTYLVAMAALVGLSVVYVVRHLMANISSDETDLIQSTSDSDSNSSAFCITRNDSDKPQQTAGNADHQHDVLISCNARHDHRRRDREYSGTDASAGAATTCTNTGDDKVQLRNSASSTVSPPANAAYAAVLILGVAHAIFHDEFMLHDDILLNGTTDSLMHIAMAVVLIPHTRSLFVKRLIAGCAAFNIVQAILALDLKHTHICDRVVFGQLFVHPDDPMYGSAVDGSSSSSGEFNFNTSGNINVGDSNNFNATSSTLMTQLAVMAIGGAAAGAGGAQVSLSTAAVAHTIQGIRLDITQGCALWLGGYAAMPTVILATVAVALTLSMGVAGHEQRNDKRLVMELIPYFASTTAFYFLYDPSAVVDFYERVKYDQLYYMTSYFYPLAAAGWSMIIRKRC